MKPIHFPEVTTIFAENQPPYIPLPAFADGQQVISCWQLTWRERIRMLLSGKLWLAQLTFGRPLQPQLATVTSPFDPPASAIAPVLEEVPR